MKLGKSQREKEVTKVASVAIFNDEGLLLFGKRNDNGKWTLPGGHLEGNEDPQDGAIREAKEETGLEVDGLTYLGDGQPRSIQVYSYAAQATGTPDGSTDPDEECSEWRWVEPDKVPAEIMDNLHSPENVTLRFLGIQEGTVDAPLSKGDIVAVKPLPVQHYGKPGLKFLDPKYQGTGAVGPEANRGKRIPRTYYYTRPGVPEAHIASGSTLYHGQLPVGTKLYDFGKDELKLLEPKWVQTKYGQEYHPADLDVAEKQLHKRGYHGYHNYGVKDAIAYFHPLPVKEVKAALKKTSPPFLLPKLGISDDRRETEVVNKPSTIKTKMLLTAAGNHRAATQQPHQDVSQDWEKYKEHATARTEKVLQPGSSLRGMTTGTDTGVSIGMAFGHHAPEAVRGTQLHENLHLLLNRVQKKYGHQGRVILAQNLHNAMPAYSRQSLDMLQRVATGDSYRGAPFEHEEKLARLLNYMNDKSHRNRFQEAIASVQDDPLVADRYYKHHDRTLRLGYRALQAAADMADESWATGYKWPLIRNEDTASIIEAEIAEAEPLSKGLLSTIVAGAMAIHPDLQAAFDKVNPPAHQVAAEQVAKWSPEGLSADMHPIAHLESSWGFNTNHLVHPKGEFETAHGAVGFKPSTAHEEWQKSPSMQKKFPGLGDPATFLQTFKSDHHFYNQLASSHFARLKQRHGSEEKAAYAWRWGSGACAKANDEQIMSDAYVQKYRHMRLAQLEGKTLKKSHDWSGHSCDVCGVDIEVARSSFALSKSAAEGNTDIAGAEHVRSALDSMSDLVQHRHEHMQSLAADHEVPHEEDSALIPADCDRCNAIPRLDATHTADLIAKEHDGQVMGYAHSNQELGQAEGGHEFALIDGRYLADWWANHNYGTPDLFDLNNATHRQQVEKLYGSPSSWKEVADYRLRKTASESALGKRIIPFLTDDLRRAPWRGNSNCLAGHCYVASEALWHLLGGPKSGYTPQAIRHEGSPHWYLKHKTTGKVIDLTSDQFATPVPYEKGVGKGFLTKEPSKRAQNVIDSVLRSTGSLKKMAIKDIPVGDELGIDSPGQVFDYNHLVPKKLRTKGYTIQVHQQEPSKTGAMSDFDAVSETPLAAQLYHNDRQVGRITGFVGNFADGGPTDLHIQNSEINRGHRGRGFGIALYEALYAHSYHHHETRSVWGGLHSTAANAVHQKLAAKHGLKYSPHAKGPFEGRTKDFDNRYDGYDYKLKSEMPMSKMAIKDIQPGREITQEELESPEWQAQGPHHEAVLIDKNRRSETYGHTETYDYSHLLPAHIRSDGAKLLVSDSQANKVPGRAMLHAFLVHSKYEVPRRTYGARTPYNVHADPHQFFGGKVEGTKDAPLSPEYAERFSNTDNYSASRGLRYAGTDDYEPTRDNSLSVDYAEVSKPYLGRGVGQALYEAMYAHGLHHHNVKRVVGGEHSSMAHKAHERLAAKHGLHYSTLPNNTRLARETRPGPFDEKFSDYMYDLKSEIPMSKSDEGIERLLTHDSPTEQILALKSKHVEPFHLRMALFSEHPEVSKFAATHPAMTKELISEALRHPDIDVRRAALARPDINDEHLEQVMFDPDLQALAASHPALTLDQRQRLAAHPLTEPGVKQYLMTKSLDIWLDIKKHEGINDTAYDDMLGFSSKSEVYISAAEFLAGKQIDVMVFRLALVRGKDVQAAALHGVGLEVTPKELEALEAVVKLQTQSKLQKKEVKHTVVPATADAKTTADAVQRAFDQNQTQNLDLNGKHSAGSISLTDPESAKLYLLKPGSGRQSPARGSSEELASQSRREAAFWHVAKNWGLQERFPRCDLLIVDGKETAALHMLPLTWRNLETLKFKDAALPWKALEKYRQTGEVHKWALLDAVCGNPDRHGQNIMVGPQSESYPVALIDHGSAFAGNSFDPAHDEASFIPYYLRASRPDWDSLDNKAKLRSMPEIPDTVDMDLREWFNSIHVGDLEAILVAYGIDPAPAVRRFQVFKQLLSSPDKFCRVINSYWLLK